MTVTHIEVLVEEPSIEAALRALLPRILGSVTFDVHPFRGKHDLLGQLANRLRGYATWLPDNWCVFVLVDRDNDDCNELKTTLEGAARKAKLATRRTSPAGEVRVVTRLAIEELEAWYFGDWEAVRAAYPRVAAGVPLGSAFRDPDAIRNTWERFEKELQRAGYFIGGLRKIEAARTIAAHWDPDRNVSRSFCTFRDAVRLMAS